MRIIHENLPKSRVKLTIEVPAEKMGEFFNQAYKKLASTVEIKGFRPGQAPRSMILESIGYGRYQQQVLDLAFPSTYSEAIKQEKINPIQPPAIAIKEFGEKKNLIYEAEVDIMPEIKLGDYKKIKITRLPARQEYKKPKIEAKEVEIEEILKRLQYQAAQFKEANRRTKKGDRVEVDFEGFIDKIKQDNLSSKNHPLIIGGASLIPGFEERLVDLKKGEEREFDLEVPHIGDRSKTKKAHFKVKINDIKEVILPEINNAFAQKFGHQTPGELKKAIGQSIILEKENRERQDLEKAIFNKLLAVSEIELPESLVEQEINRRISQIQSQTGPGFEKFLEKIKKSINDLRQDLRAEAEKTVKIGLFLGEIARREGILTKGPIKDQETQIEVTRRTIGKLIEYAIK